MISGGLTPLPSPLPILTLTTLGRPRAPRHDTPKPPAALFSFEPRDASRPIQAFDTGQVLDLSDSNLANPAPGSGWPIPGRVPGEMLRFAVYQLPFFSTGWPHAGEST